MIKRKILKAEDTIDEIINEVNMMGDFHNIYDFKQMVVEKLITYDVPANDYTMAYARKAIKEVTGS